MTATPLFLFSIQTIWTAVPELFKPQRDVNSSLGSMEKQILLPDVMSLSRTLASPHAITPWHDYEGSIDELEITRALCTASPPLCTYIFLFPSSLLLINWLHRGGLQSMACLHSFYCPHVMKQALSSCTPLKFTSTFSFPKSDCHCSTGISASPPSPELPPPTEHQRTMQDIKREGRNVENILGLAVRSTVGKQMPHGMGLVLLGKELGLHGSFASSFDHSYNSWFKLPQTIAIT